MKVYLHGFILCLIISLTPLFALQVNAQNKSIEETEAELKNLYGLEKLKALNRLTEHYQDAQNRKAIRFGRQAVILGKNIFTELNTSASDKDKKELVKAYFQLGELLYDKGHFFQSREQLQSAKSLAVVIDDEIYLYDTEDYLEDIQEMIEEGEIKENILNKAFRDVSLRKVVTGATNDLKVQAEIRNAKTKAKKKDYEEAIAHYNKAINFLKNTGDIVQINELQLNVAYLLDSLNKHAQAQAFLTEVVTEIEEQQNDVESLYSEVDVESKEPFNYTLEKQDLPEIADVPAVTGFRNKEFQKSLRLEQEKIKGISDRYAKQRDYEKSLAYYKMYQELSQKMVEDSLKAAAENMRRENEMLLLKQQKKIADLNVEALAQEREKQVRFRNTAIVVILLVLLSTLVTFYFYMSKRREHKKLSIAFRDLDNTKNKLEGAEEKIVKLLRQQVSGDVAMELLTNGTNKPGGRCFVCIMFLDIRDFTPMAEKLSPEEIIDYQNNVFGFMIDIVQKYNGTINQLLGDGFMATFGAPVSHGNDCQNAFLAAKEILHEVKERNEARLIPRTRVGIGLHAGHVVTGNVGNEKRKQYSVTGNPVIIASRVEQLNKTYKSQLIITEEVCTKLDQPLTLNQPFLEVEVKGRSNPVKILKIA